MLGWIDPTGPAAAVVDDDEDESDAGARLLLVGGEPSDRLRLFDLFRPKASSLLTSSIARRSSLFPDVEVRSKYFVTVGHPCTYAISSTSIRAAIFSKRI